MKRHGLETISWQPPKQAATAKVGKTNCISKRGSEYRVHAVRERTTEQVVDENVVRRER
jgi:hypothetical protein